MWNSSLAKRLSKLVESYKALDNTMGTKRERIMKAALLAYLRQRNEALHDAVLTEFAVSGEVRFGDFIRRLCGDQRCSLCKKHVVCHTSRLVCSLCNATPGGKAYTRRVNTERLQDYWANNYDTALAQQRATSRKRFGTDFPWQSKKVQNTKRRNAIARTGHAHHFHDPAIRLKQQKSAMRIKEFKFGGRVIQCQGYEPYALKAAANKYGISDIVGQFDSEFEPLAFDAPYSPDFYIKSKDLYVEVKSVYTLLHSFERNRGLAEQAYDEQINLRWVVVFPHQRRIITLPHDWWTYSRRKVERLLTL